MEGGVVVVVVGADLGLLGLGEIHMACAGNLTGPDSFLWLENQCWKHKAKEEEEEKVGS